MPINQRIRDNNVFGTVSDNPLTAGSLTLNSGGLVNLSAIVSKHAIITLDPLRQYGSPEIIIVTSHTASSTVATISRGAYGTVPRQHPLGTLWVHAPLNEDFIQILSSITRPADPYRGQMIFEYDTDKFVARSISDIWQDAIPLSAWTSWTPTVTSLSGGTTFAKYAKIGRIVHFRFRYVLAGAGVGTNPQFTLPFAPSADYTGQDPPIGQSFLIDNTTASYPGEVVFNAGSTADIRCFNAAGTYVVMNTITNLIPFTWAVNDALWAYGTYEAVS